MKHLSLSLMFLLSILSSAFAGDEDLTTVCAERDAPVSWKYCVTRTAGSTNADILYFMHGGTGDEHSWVDPDNYTWAIREHWRQTGYAAPTIVTVSFGPYWLLTEPNENPYSGLLRVLVNDIIPYIENSVLNGPKGTRLLIGTSMGGFNASALVLKFPKMFRRAVIACPAVSSLSPFSTEDEIKAYVARTGARSDWVSRLFEIIQPLFPTPESWELNSPLLVGKELFSEETPPLLITVGSKDEFGFQEGSGALASLAISRRARSVQWSVVEDGGHCTVDVQAIAKFLAQ